LPMSARIATLEGDMYEVRHEIDSVQTAMRKLSGKVYRGISLGDTVDAMPVGQLPEPDIGPGTGTLPSKADLYERAAQLRRR